MVVNLLLYEHWGIRLDSTFLNYIDSPKEMIASISYANLFFIITIWLTSSIVYSKIVFRIFNFGLSGLRKGKVWEVPLLLLVTASLVIVMRGGLQTIPINQSDVYFSDNIIANHAAINFMWNLGQSINQNSYDTRNPFVELDMKKASNIFDDAMEPLVKEDTSDFQILKTSKPNVIAQPNKINENFCAQTDFAYSLLNVLDGDNEKFEYGKNIFKCSSSHFAHYIFKNGFGTINKDGAVVYDYIGKKLILQKGNSPKIMKELGLAITQISYQNFTER